MRTIAEYVSTLSEETIHDIIQSYEQFVKDGSIGDEPIRIHARTFMEAKGVEPHYITMWMTYMAMECYRYFYHKSS